MVVMKFGGTSVGSPEGLRTLKSHLAQRQGEQVVCVVSAFSGITNLLSECSITASEGGDYGQLFNQIEQRHLNLIGELLPARNQSDTIGKVKILLNNLEEIFHGVSLIKELSPKSSDLILSFGEILSAEIIVDFLNAEGIKAELGDSRSLILTDSTFTKAVVDFDATKKKVTAFFRSAADLVICPGFVAADSNGSTTTLGRGGSDYTAAILASTLKAGLLEIWTDVDGLMTADPRKVKSSYPIESVSYSEALELSHFGAKVIYPPTIQPVLNDGIPIKVRNTFNPEVQGTTISSNHQGNGRLVSGLSSIENIALVNFSGVGMIGVPKFAYRFFKALSEAQVNIIMITQASSEHSICVAIDVKGIQTAEAAIRQEFELELEKGTLNQLEVETDLAIVALVGDKMQEHVGISGRMFAALGENGVNIKAIAQGSSELNVTAVIDQRNLKKALNVLHESFFLSSYKRIHLFIIGVGNVGSILIDQISQQNEYLRENERIDIKLVGIANSKKMFFDETGVDWESWKDKLIDEGESMDSKVFANRIDELNLRNSVFVDNTANESIAGLYHQLLVNNISVVTPNKIACSSSYETYLQLKNATQEFNSTFLFETNVGAGLPIISTINSLIKSGDKIHRIEAVLSGSLNFIFNNFNSDTSFADIVQEAVDQGYAEPNPATDLSGLDVQRKLLILLREIGEQVELDDIENNSFVSEECLSAKTVEQFFELLRKEEETFQQLLASAEANECRLKYVASFNNGSASIGLQEVDPSHSFYHLDGKDNIVLIYTNRYNEQPLVIKGAGAGAQVTAAGIFADIISIANN